MGAGITGAAIADALASAGVEVAVVEAHTRVGFMAAAVPTRTSQIGEKPQIMGILDEGKEIMDEYKGSPALDAGLLAAAQAVEHYEISRYGTLRTWAEELGHRKSMKLLQATLDEEKATDQALTELAPTVVNQEGQAEAAE
jgi:ferritin-like metal-binding protein YciE